MFRLNLVMFMLLRAVVAMAQPALVCRGVEESGRNFIGQPGFGPHLISIFSTGADPISGSRTVNDHVAWVCDPLHSYVPDGTGALCIWAHPSSVRPEALLAVPGLAGFELNYAGFGAQYDEIADGIWRGCVAQKRPFLWGYAADDTHGPGGLSWYSARLGEVNERALKQALRTGGFYVSSGPVISDLQVQGQSVTVTLQEPGDVCWLRAGQFFSADKPEPIAVEVTKEPGRNRCLQLDRAVTTSTLTLDKLGIAAGDLQFVRAIVGLTPDKMAQTQPLRVEAGGQIISTIPAQGTWIRGQTHNHNDAGPGALDRLAKYRAMYLEKGEQAAFCTDYSYWETPHQWPASDGTPGVLSVQPDRLKVGEKTPLTITGVNFGPKPRVQIGSAAARVLEATPEQIKLEAPALPPGQYDVVVDNERFRGTAALAFTVQDATARNTGWTTYGVAQGLPYHRCLTIACPGGDVWVGTIRGLGRFREGKWEAMNVKIGGNAIYALAADAAGGVWVATDKSMAHCDAAGAWTASAVGHTENVDKSRSTERWGRMAFDKEGTLWVLNRWNAGLGVRKGDAWSRMTVKDGAPTNGAVSIACDRDGRVWLGAGKLHRLVEGTWEQVPLPASLGGGQTVVALGAQPDGSVLAALNGTPDQGALVRFAEGQAEVIPLDKTAIPSPRVRDMLVSKAGDTWFGTDYGLTRLGRDGKWEHFNTRNSGLGCNIVLGLAEDAQGRLWLATAEGVSCFDPSVK